MELLNKVRQRPFEVEFSNKPSVLINHSRNQRPLVQVVLPGNMGWNVGGWNDPGTPWNIGGPVEDLLPDDQYTLRHIDDDSFLVLFGVVRSGRIIYF